MEEKKCIHDKKVTLGEGGVQGNKKGKQFTFGMEAVELNKGKIGEKNNAFMIKVCSLQSPQYLFKTSIMFYRVYLPNRRSSDKGELEYNLLVY